MTKILIVEDEDILRQGIAVAFRDRGWAVTEAADGAEAIEHLDGEVFDVLVTDFKMPKKNGLDVLRRCKALNEGTVALIMTAYGTVESAVEAMKAGAYDYVLKPFDLEELELKVERALKHRRLLARVRAQEVNERVVSFESMVGESPQMKEVFETIRKVSRSNATVLILGETGTGKELVAEAVHRNSDRSERPFVKLNCAALQESLLESELFGHERGAFTGADRQRIGRFEMASEGTLFLDEIGNMSASTQAKVLRVLQEREFERLGGSRTIKIDVRLIAATNRNLEESVTKGEFREDLFYRLNVVCIKVPPLRERREDILPLARHFVSRFAAELKKHVEGLDGEAARALGQHTWPGNIRELENTVERAVLMCEGGALTAQDLKLASRSGATEGGTGTLNLKLPPAGIRLEDLEKHAILEALRMHGWVQKDAARFLGISSRMMNYKVAKYEIKNARWSRNKEETGQEKA
jgi:DNA-binding NtrC family response regulator